MTWIKALGITSLLLLVVAFGVLPSLIEVLQERSIPLPSVTVHGIEMMSNVHRYWYVFLVLGIVLTLIPTKSIEDARVPTVEPYLLFIVIAVMLLLIGILALPLLTEMAGAPPPLKKK